jgi:hypothetical protein
MWPLGQQSSRKLTPAIPATRARDLPVSEHEDAAEILRHSRLGPELFKSGTPPRQSRTVQQDRAAALAEWRTLVA